MELATARLRLRPIESGDVHNLVAVYADTEVTRFLNRMTLEETADQAERFAREWEDRGYGILAIIEAESGEFVGRSGLHYWPQFDEVEAGWVLRRDVWGRGYATEAGAETLRWGFEDLRLDMITAIIAKENGPSIAVAERLGMSPYRDDELFNLAVTVYAKRQA